jgi:hypothetical protein
MIKNENTVAFLLILVFIGVGSWVIFHFDGTGDTGDSITHFLYACYAFSHPENLINHWAKPFFTLVAAPFAQFGFIGIKFFNLLNAALTLGFVFKIAQRFQLKNPLIALIILATCSSYFSLTFSGLTEHFHAFLLTFALYLFLTEGVVMACIIVSFLPFVRSEGLLIVGIVGLYLLFKKYWKHIPLLAIGHIVYGIVGSFYHGSIWWVFNKISYATATAYGKGSLGHFFEQLYYMTGLPHIILWSLGCIYLYFLIKNRAKISFFLENTLLVYGSFWILFIAHTLFWYYGIFMSYGLGRVLNAVMPMFALIALQGFNFLTHLIKNTTIRYWFSIIIATYILIFPFTKHPSAINPDISLKLEADQKTGKQISDLIIQQFPDYVVYVLHPQVMLTLGYDIFDKNKIRDLRDVFIKPLAEKSIVVWDSRFGVIDGGISLENMKNETQLIEIQHFNTDNNFKFVIFKNK